jgi:DegV family protein with EDD domain
MSSIAIITDSTSYIPKEYVSKFNISVAPQVLIWGDKTYRDGIDIQPDEFYERLSKAKVMPTTSQVTIATFKEMFGDLLEKHDQVLAILISSKFSGTIDSAIQARDMLPGKTIEIVDSETTAMALGFLTMLVAQAAEQGASLAECIKLAEAAKKNTGVLFAVDTLEFLHRGGRIGGGARFLGTALNLKPILEVRNGRVEAIERIRTRKKSLQRVVELVTERVGNRQPVRMATLHANAHADAEELLQEIGARVKITESVFSEVSPVVGTHAGPGTVGLAFLAGF